MDVLYFDNHMIVVNKPAGIPVESSEGDSLESRVKLWVKETYDKKGDVFLHAAHRIDKPVSGIVLLAKTSKALARLQESFRSRLTRKTYLALVEGVLEKEEDLLEDYLVHNSFCAASSSKDDPRAKYAALSYKLKKKGKTTSLLEVDLHTGRYHQIRFQFGSRGHPILQDKKYGASSAQECIGLHHATIAIPHPISKKEMVFTAPFPPYFEKWIEQLNPL
jgi:23S rRNA pseudouridine1911/1915/1917 synthase